MLQMMSCGFSPPSTSASPILSLPATSSTVSLSLTLLAKTSSMESFDLFSIGMMSDLVLFKEREAHRILSGQEYEEQLISLWHV